jgi:hypothetical protein
MQTHIDCRFPDATWLALTYRAGTLLTAICEPAPGGPRKQTQLSNVMGRKLPFLTAGCKRRRSQMIIDWASTTSVGRKSVPSRRIENTCKGGANG